jgi:hypothetical protein
MMGLLGAHSGSPKEKACPSPAKKAAKAAEIPRAPKLGIFVVRRDLLEEKKESPVAAILAAEKAARDMLQLPIRSLCVQSAHHDPKWKRTIFLEVTEEAAKILAEQQAGCGASFSQAIGGSDSCSGWSQAVADA